MKITTLSTFMWSGVFLCASVCCPEDDFNYTNYNATIADLTIIENPQTAYQVNDTLFINTLIPYNITTDTMETLDLSSTDDPLFEDAVFQYSLQLRKDSAYGNATRVLPDSMAVITYTGFTYTDDNYVSFTTERTASGFSHRYGLILKESGTYELGANLSGGTTRSTFYYLEGNNANVSLRSVINPSVVNESYRFTVTN